MKQNKSPTYKPRANSANVYSRNQNKDITQNIKIIKKNIEEVEKEISDINDIIQENETIQAENYEKNIIITSNIKSYKEKLILALRKKLDYCKKLNEKLLIFKKENDKAFNYYKRNYFGICKFKKDLIEDLADFVKTLDQFTSKVDKLNQEKKLIIMSNEGIVENKLKEQNELKEYCEQLNTNIKKQTEEIEGLMERLRCLRNRNSDYFASLDQKEIEYSEKYEELLQEYKKIEREFTYYYDMEMQKIKKGFEDKNINLLGEEKNIRLKENQLKNNYLKQFIGNIKMKMLEVEKQNQKQKDQERILKMLGKNKANQYLKTLEEKVKNDNISLTTIPNKTPRNYPMTTVESDLFG